MMKSLQHVLWRGVFALGLMAVGIGSGIGMAPAEAARQQAECAGKARILIASPAHGDLPRDAAVATAVIVRRGVRPAQSES